MKDMLARGIRFRGKFKRQTTSCQCLCMQCGVILRNNPVGFAAVQDSKAGSQTAPVTGLHF